MVIYHNVHRTMNFIYLTDPGVWELSFNINLSYLDALNLLIFCICPVLMDRMCYHAY